MALAPSSHRPAPAGSTCLSQPTQSDPPTNEEKEGRVGWGCEDGRVCAGGEKAKRGRGAGATGRSCTCVLLEAAPPPQAPHGTFGRTARTRAGPSMVFRSAASAALGSRRTPHASISGAGQRAAPLSPCTASGAAFPFPHTAHISAAVLNTALRSNTQRDAANQRAIWWCLAACAARATCTGPPPLARLAGQRHSMARHGGA